MFKVVSKHLFWWPVSVRLPDPSEAGKILVQRFEAQFEAMPRDRARELDAANAARPAEEREAHAFDFLHEIVRGWRDIVQEDGASVPFSTEVLTQQLQLPWFRDAVLLAYGEATGGQEARLGN